MDKLQYRSIQRAWQKFDRSTAMGCAQRKEPFDVDRCKDSWTQYNIVLQSYGIPPLPNIL